MTPSPKCVMMDEVYCGKCNKNNEPERITTEREMKLTHKIKPKIKQIHISPSMNSFSMIYFFPTPWHIWRDFTAGCPSYRQAFIYSDWRQAPWWSCLTALLNNSRLLNIKSTLKQNRKGPVKCKQNLPSWRYLPFISRLVAVDVTSRKLTISRNKPNKPILFITTYWSDKTVR